MNKMENKISREPCGTVVERPSRVELENRRSYDKRYVFKS